MKSLRAFEIVEFVEERKFCSIAELIDRFGVSPATIHRDIAALTAAGSIRKVHGGVASLSSVRTVVQNPDSMPSHYRDRMKLDKSFISGIGLTRNGVFSRHENHTFLLHRILEQSNRNYLLMGSSKFGRAGLFSIAPLSSFSKIISDRELPAYAGHSKKHAADLQIPESGV